MSDDAPKRGRGRPPKADDERFTHFLYIRLTEEQYKKVEWFAKRQGFAKNGGMSAGARWAWDKLFDILNPPKK